MNKEEKYFVLYNGYRVPTIGSGLIQIIVISLNCKGE